MILPAGFRERLRQAQQPQPSGGEPLPATLQAVVPGDAQMAADSGAPKHVLLVADGMPNCDQANPCANEAWSDG